MLFEDRQKTAADTAAPAPCDERVFDALGGAVRQLIDDGALTRTLPAGAMAPLFALPDAFGKEIRLEQLLRKGPVVMTFYRGLWCPSCNGDLRELNACRDDILARGGQIVAISQQTEAYSRKTQRSNHLRFPVLSDVHGAVCCAYGVQWTVPDYLRTVLLASGTDLSRFNGNDSWSLPMVARYVISRDGMVSYAEINANPDSRSGPQALLPILERLDGS